MEKLKTRPAPPYANCMFESLRGMNYSAATAIADVIDNSIAAEATKIDVEVRWSGSKSYIAIIDNGHGMTDADLFKAMHLGNINPLSVRAPRDLGRFGFGLKTASLSQCRGLTVGSRTKADPLAVLRWDLDFLAKQTEWLLLESPGEQASRIMESISDRQQGTIVVWEKLDKIVTQGFTADNFLDLVDNIKLHLSWVYHRFLQPSHPRLSLLLNGHPVKPADPFMKTHPSAWHSPPDPISTPDGEVMVKAHILPHKDKLSEKEFMDVSGPKGWTAHQGFHIFRNDRLLLSGGWLNLGSPKAWPQEEAYKLARIELDIPNTADAAWKLDIKKSTATPPVMMRPQLLHLATTIRDRARRVFVHKGEYTPDTEAKNIIPVWNVSQNTSGPRYRIDRQHPAVQNILSLGPDIQKELLALLSLIETSVPVVRIWLDTTESSEKDELPGASVPNDAMKQILSTVYRSMLNRGMSPQEARNKLKKTEPFYDFPAIVDALPDTP